MDSKAKEVIELIYGAINRRDIDSAMEWIDEQCIYQDLNFPQPFIGKEQVKELFAEAVRGIPDDLQFVIDDFTTEDSLAVGVLWHLELNGITFPNSRGVSFYRLSEKTNKLVFGRDLVESPIKLGKAAFFIIRLVMPLIRLRLQNQEISPKELN
ncbi:MAG TPA: nuclear transport factor 2 family protein [Cyanothece sp. UBA12306]|nr:nuclear transport factor 2 family protein [Cyanothece sp. UBA12306]